MLATAIGKDQAPQLAAALQVTIWFYVTSEEKEATFESLKQCTQHKNSEVREETFTALKQLSPMLNTQQKDHLALLLVQAADTKSLDHYKHKSY